jgi:hypothetical protein
MRVQARPRTAGKDSWGRARQKSAGRDSRAYQLEPQIIEQGIMNIEVEELKPEWRRLLGDGLRGKDIC